jgi:hypothetical protein
VAAAPPVTAVEHPAKQLAIDAGKKISSPNEELKVTYYER